MLFIEQYLPEFFVLFFAISEFFLFMFKKEKLSLIIAIIGVFFSLSSLFTITFIPFELYRYFIKILILISAVLILLIKNKKIHNQSNFYFIYLMSVFFIMMTVNSDNYLSLYVNIELFSIMMYFLLSYDKKNISLSETIKYLLIQVISSGFLLMGTALFYGFCETINFYDIGEYINNHSNYSLTTYIFPYFLIISGLFFKLGLFPFANWMIDIYRNIDTKIVAYISIIPKLGIAGALMHILNNFHTFETGLIIIIFALITALFGVLYGIKSKNLKEVMACSSYLNVSFILITIAIYSKLSLSASLFYFFNYIFMNTGAFTCIISLENSQYYNKNYDYCGYFYKNPLFSICFLITIISLLGLPLTSGFISKIYLFISIVNSGLLSILLLFSMFIILIISLIMYFKIIKNMFIKCDKNCQIKLYKINNAILYTCIAFIIFVALYPVWLIHICKIIALYI